MSNWVCVASVSDCPPGSGCEVVAGGRLIALFHVDDKFYAMDGVCPHQGGPLGKGSLSGCIVTCPWHGWQFDMRTGEQQITRSIVHPTFPVKVENDEVFVDVGDE